MSTEQLLTKIKNALGITGDFQDDTLTVYINEVKGVMLGAGVPESVVNSEAAVGCIARGVVDLWNYGSGNAKLSEYFRLRMLQLRIETSSDDEGGDENVD